MQPIIEIKNFVKFYDDFKAVDIDYLSLFPGEILAILGPNGAGKTTTLETLEGLRLPTSGELTIKGFNVQTEYHKIRKMIGVQLQSQSLPPTITVSEAMALFCRYYDVEPRYDLLERFDLIHHKDKQFHQLSVGQQRKLALAIAISHSPEILILDEPTAGLDVNVKAELHEILKELRNNNTAIILSSHDLFEIEKLADRVAILLNGKIMTIATPSEIKNTYDVIKIHLKTKEHLLKDFKQDVIISSSSNNDYYTILIHQKDIHVLLSNLMSFLDSKGDEVIDMNIEKSSLEERFIALTSRKEGI